GLCRMNCIFLHNHQSYGNLLKVIGGGAKKSPVRMCYRFVTEVVYQDDPCDIWWRLSLLRTRLLAEFPFGLNRASSSTGRDGDASGLRALPLFWGHSYPYHYYTYLKHQCCCRRARYASTDWYSSPLSVKASETSPHLQDFQSLRIVLNLDIYVQNR